MKLKIGTIQEFDPTRVEPFAGQPRKRFTGIEELAASIRSVGQQIPGKVLPADGKVFDVQLVDGERRLRACILAKKLFRAEVCAATSEQAQFESSLAANFGRQDHDCIEIAHALQRLKDAGRSVKQIAEICGGKSDCWVYQHLSLLNLHPTLQAMLIPAGENDDEERRPLNLSNALKLGGFDQGAQLELAGKIKGKSTIEARRMILTRARETPGKSMGRVRSPSDRFDSLTNCVIGLTHRLAVYSEMQREQLRQTIMAGNVEQRGDVIAYINELNDQLSSIADELENSMKKPRK